METQPLVHWETFEYLNKRAPVLFFTLSKEGVVLEANQFSIHITGRQLIGDNFRNILVDFSGQFDLSAWANDPSKERMIHIGCASHLPQSFYFTFKRASDQILAFGRLDTEELENMRTEVLSLNQELNNLTRELHKKNAQLKRLNEEKNRFLGMAAHDLRKPIGLVITYSDFLIEETESVLDKEHIGFLNTINASCTFMKRLVDDFLDVSAIEAGRFEVDLQPASIDEILSHSLKLNSLQAVKKGIDLLVHRDENLPSMVMDAPKIEQAITNLVSNAIEHTDLQSQVVITLSCDQQFLTFSVKDQGPGIPIEEQKKLFKPFGKATVKKTGGEKSTGLGMLITRKIIEAHKGNIWLDSQLGEGTTVKFKVPINREMT